MSSFEYLIALVSVIAGLGIARALSGIARLLDTRRNISVSWIPLCWTASVLLWLVAFWWFTFLLSSFGGWSTWLHVFVLIYAGAIFFLLALLFPESPEDGFDMLEHFLDNRKMFFGGLLVLAFIDIADTGIKYQIGLMVPSLARYGPLMLSWILMSAIAMKIRSKTYHAVIAVAYLLMIVFWMSFSVSGLLTLISEPT